MRRFIAALVVAAAACGEGGAGPAKLTPDQAVAEIDAVAGALVAGGKVAGLSVAVWKDGRELLARGWGVADRESGAPAGADTPYRILSISKQVTAVALLRLVETGAVGLDDPIAAFFPTMGAAADQIRVRHLLSHTSGLPELWQVPGWETAGTTAELAALYDGRATVTPPGNVFSYRNVNFVFAGLIVERVTGEALPLHLERTLFAPLGMTSTGFCDDTLATRGYLAGLSPAPELQLAPDEGSASLCSTVRDLAVWQAAYDDHRLLGPALTELARTRTSTLSGTVAYGLGVDMSLGGTRDTVGHGGSGEGWIASLVHDVDADVTVIVLSNTSDAAVGAARAEITAAALAIP